MCQTKESNKRAPGRVVIHISGPFSINGSQLAKMKKSIPDMSLP